MDNEQQGEPDSLTPRRAGRPRVLLADDHTLVVEAFTRLLEPQFEVVGTVSDGRSLLDVAPRLNPDVVLLDLSMPLMSGTEAGERLKKILPRTKIIVLTMTEDPNVAADVLRAWASGLVLKKSMASEVSRAIRDVLHGKRYVTAQMRGKLLDTFVRGGTQAHATTLTPRQREVLQLLAEGHTMKETADILHVTPRTVAFHKYRLMEELGMKNNSELLRFAIRERLVSLS